MKQGPIHIFYATVSGNAEALAEETARVLSQGERTVVVRHLAEVAAAELREVEVGLFIVSTWGDGEPPPDAAEFFAGIGREGAWRLERMAYAVLALGSSTYPDFCGCGRRLEEDLAGRGARRLLARVECDVKFKTTFADWLRRVNELLEAR